MTVYTRPDNGSKIERAFERFHADHPEVYVELARLARQLKKRGRERFGIGLLFEVCRWRTMVGEHRLPRLNNNFRALYARELMAREPDLNGVFATRRLGVPSHRVP